MCVCDCLQEYRHTISFGSEYGDSYYLSTISSTPHDTLRVTGRHTAKSRRSFTVLPLANTVSSSFQQGTLILPALANYQWTYVLPFTPQLHNFIQRFYRRIEHVLPDLHDDGVQRFDIEILLPCPLLLDQGCQQA